MLDPANLFLFFLAAVTLAVTPGPDMILVLSRSVSQGTQAGLVTVLGFALGIYGHALAAGLGLSAILMASSYGFAAIALAGGGYLLYLAFTTLRSQDGAIRVKERLAPLSLPLVFRQAFFTNLLNPKVALFFLALLPQFLRPEDGYILLQVVILATILNVTGGIVNGAIALAGGQLARWLSAHPKVVTLQRYLLAAVFAVLGLRLLITVITP